MAGRKLSSLDATLLVMGGIVGVGIFFTPQSVAERAHEPWAFLAVWLFGGLIAMCAALTFAELGATFPRAGGWFVYLREGFGAFPAFLFAWIVLFVVSTGATAAMARFCATMLHDAFPGTLPAPEGRGSELVAAAIVAGVTAVVLLGVKRAALFQNACMVLKLTAVGALVVAGLALAAPEATAPVATAVAPEAGGGPTSIVAGMAGALTPVFFAYGGWQMVGYLAPEVERPERVLPRAIVLGVGGVILVYLLFNAALLRGLGIEALGGDPRFASRLALEGFGPGGRRLLAGGMAISALGVITVTIIASPWLYVGMSRERLFFESFGRLHPVSGVPVPALLVQALVALVYLFAGDIDFLVDSVVFVEWIFHGLVALALLRLRRLRAELPRPFRSPLYPLAPLVYLVAALLVFGGTLWQAEPRLTTTGLAILGAGALVYLPWRRRAR